MLRPARKTAHRAARASGRARARGPARRVVARRPTVRAAPLPYRMREDRRSPRALPLWRGPGDRGAIVRTPHSRLPSNAETTSPPARRNLLAAAREERARSYRILPAPRFRSTRNQRVRNRSPTSSSVVLPLPETPRIATSEPDGTKRSTPRRIGVPPKVLVNAAMRRSAIAIAVLRTRPRLSDWPGATWHRSESKSITASKGAAAGKPDCMYWPRLPWRGSAFRAGRAITSPSTPWRRRRTPSWLRPLDPVR